jgi:hypothetical protein
VNSFKSSTSFDILKCLKGCRLFEIYLSLFFAVSLVVINTYFLLGGLPLLTLKHDVETDATFIRKFFELNCQLSFVSTIGASVSFGLWGKWFFVAGSSWMFCMAFFVKSQILPRMRTQGTLIREGNLQATAKFRRLHAAILLLLLMNIVLLVNALVHLSIG